MEGSGLCSDLKIHISLACWRKSLGRSFRASLEALRLGMSDVSYGRDNTNCERVNCGGKEYCVKICEYKV